MSQQQQQKRPRLQSLVHITLSISPDAADVDLVFKFCELVAELSNSTSIGKQYISEHLLQNDYSLFEARTFILDSYPEQIIVGYIIGKESPADSTSYHIATLCARKGYGTELFHEFRRSTLQNNYLTIRIESLLDPLIWWIKVGFKFARKNTYEVLNIPDTLQAIQESIPPEWTHLIKPHELLKKWIDKVYLNITKVKDRQMEKFRDVNITISKKYTNYTKIEVKHAKNQPSRQVRDTFHNTMSQSFIDEETGFAMIMNLGEEQQFYMGQQMCAICYHESDNLFKDQRTGLILCGRECQEEFYN